MSRVLGTLENCALTKWITWEPFEFDRKEFGMKTFGLIILGVVIGMVPAFYFAYTWNTATTKHDLADSIEDSDIEEKIQENTTIDPQPVQSHFQDKDFLFRGCDPNHEIKAIQERLECQRSTNKAPKSWARLHVAEIEVLQLLKKRDFKSLTPFISCDAYDLTWSELHCEADRIPVTLEALVNLQVFLEQRNPNILKRATWTRVKPDRRKIRNPRWIVRSRLKNQLLQLDAPWKRDSHPTENGTIIMLEKRLDGKVYIVGIPITGVGDDPN